jgi:hypothetical protein
MDRQSDGRPGIPRYSPLILIVDAEDSSRDAASKAVRRSSARTTRSKLWAPALKA